jgi:hypothetical protein
MAQILSATAATPFYIARERSIFPRRSHPVAGERDTLEPLSREEAMELYENLPEHAVEYEQAFDTVVEEAAAGRPPKYDKTMTRPRYGCQTTCWNG